MGGSLRYGALITFPQWQRLACRRKGREPRRDGHTRETEEGGREGVRACDWLRVGKTDAVTAAGDARKGQGKKGSREQGNKGDEREGKEREGGRLDRGRIQDSSDLGETPK